ncbi:hypothetical protein PV08_04487 [Exophiala spinifera]|uniref:Zn(2)-C6 fungal-type domain-containing protein n=1 Tax=Exophiala spinifera TaxID=91928 RepID=A0A0D1YPZ3_9EURO|nr:uncharacterized protein PV08_04487 [Exophiala spinifera]KIW17296.1 hypothetical protein PV08_04487 [Exophiala spinifera]
MQAEEDQVEHLMREGLLAQDQHHSQSDTTEMPGLVTRADSFPGAQEMSMEAQALSPSDKKRNKLGYHRTAVACGHCRRRKIRCIAAIDDSSGRCQNCIRLKKDCHFYPVDQSSTPGKRPRSGTKSESIFIEGDASVASSSPGAMLRSSSFEHMDQDEGFEYPHPFDPHHIQQQQQGQTAAPPTYLDQAPGHFASEPINSGYYPSYAHNVPGTYTSAFPTGSLPSTMPMTQGSAYSYPTSHPMEAYDWGQMTQRPMSGAEAEDMQHGFPAAYRSHTYPNFDRRMTGPQQQMPSTNHGMMGLELDHQHSSILATTREPTSYQPLHDFNEWTGAASGQQAHHTESAPTSYPHGWYPHTSTMTGNRQERGPSHILLSQRHDFRGSQHKPG